jgi:hypothetical protein
LDYRAGQHRDLRGAHLDPQRAPAGRRRHRIELPDDQGATAVGLDDLDLESVTGADHVGRAAQRHDLSVRCRA